MSRNSSESSTCSCLSDDATIVDYSEAEQILQDVKTDLKSIRSEIKTDFAKTCCPRGKTARACKVSSVLVKLQSVDSRLLQIINLMQPDQSQHVDDLVSNFGMSVKLDAARNKLNGFKTKHAELRREWHSQEEHLNKIAKEVAKKENELKFQSVFCTTQGYVLSKMLWKSSKCDCLLDLMVSHDKLTLEVIKTLDGCLYAFAKTFQDEMPEPTADEYQYVLCLCGVLSNIASIPDGRFFLINQPASRDVYDQIIKILPNIGVPKAESLKWIMLVAIYNIMICKEGREYAKNNRYLFQSLNECIIPPHSNKIIILALKIIGNLTNDSNKAYMAYVGGILPVERLDKLQQSKDSCTIRKQAKQILRQYYSSMQAEQLLHTIQLEQSKSRYCNSACTQTCNYRKTPEVLAYYVFTDAANTRSSGYTSSGSTASRSASGSEDRSGYDSPVSARSDFDVSESFLRRPHANSVPISFRDAEAVAPYLTSISAYNARGRNNSATTTSQLAHGSSCVEDPSSYTSPLPTNCISMEYPSDIMSSPHKSICGKNLEEPMSRLSFGSNYSAGECADNLTVSAYVDSIILSALPYSRKHPAPSYGSRVYEDTSVPVLSITPTVTEVTRKKRTTNQFSSSSYLPSYGTREFEDTSVPLSNASPAPMMLATSSVSSSKSLRSNFPVNVRFNEHPSTSCHPSVWSMPPQPINTFYEATPSRSEEIQVLERKLAHSDINKLLAMTIGDHLQNLSLIKRNAGNNTIPNGQSNPSITTVFRVSKSKTNLSPNNSSGPFCNSVSTNTSFSRGRAMNDFFRIKTKNTGTSPKSSRKRVLSGSQNTEAFDIAYGGYESYCEYMENASKKSKAENVEKPHPQFDYDYINMPSTSTGYYGHETLNPFAIYPDQNVSSSGIKEEEQGTSATPQKTLGEMSESRKCTPAQSCRECRVGKNNTKTKKKPSFRIYYLGRKRKR